MLNNDFIAQMRELLGPTEAEALCKAITDSTPVTSVRLNPLKWPANAVFEDTEVTAVPWCSMGRYLKERPQFTLDPRLHAGAYYVQEAASMSIEQAWRVIASQLRAEGDTADATPAAPRRVLDLCAAPGGKSTLWRSLLPDGCLLVANEPIRQRAQILAENLTKWGHPDVVVTSAYPEELGVLDGFFDIIAADVPCSGEGMFRKDMQAREEWSREAVIACAERQWTIISDIWPALREGGWMVYSTCTYNAEEDERMVERICRELGAEIVAIPFDPAWDVTPGTVGYHFYPHRTQGEGLYIALLRKAPLSPPDWGEAAAPQASAKREKRKGGPSRSSGPGIKGGAQVKDWLADSAQWKFYDPTGTGECIAAIRASLHDDVLAVTSRVRALTAGILLAEEKGKKYVPQHALALSTVCSPNAFVRQEVDRETALSYLRHEAITLPPDCPRGYVIVTYGGLPLGFVNNLVTRANNLYPEQWRIRHA